MSKSLSNLWVVVCSNGKIQITTNTMYNDNKVHNANIECHRKHQNKHEFNLDVFSISDHTPYFQYSLCAIYLPFYDIDEYCICFWTLFLNVIARQYLLYEISLWNTLWCHFQGVTKLNLFHWEISIF